MCEQRSPSLAHSWKRCGWHFIAHWFQDGHAAVSPMRCRSWACPTCRPRLSARWTHTLTECGAPWTIFLTLTLHPGDLERLGIVADYRAQQRYVAASWKRLVRMIRKRFGSMTYVRFYEYHRERDYKGDPNARLHIHALIAGEGLPAAGGYNRKTVRYLRRRGIFSASYRGRRDAWRALGRQAGFGRTRAVYLNALDTHSAARYVAKYATKRKPAVYSWRVRHVASSRDVRHAAVPVVATHSHLVVSPFRELSAPVLSEALADGTAPEALGFVQGGRHLHLLAGPIALWMRAVAVVQSRSESGPASREHRMSVLRADGPAAVQSSNTKTKQWHPPNRRNPSNRDSALRRLTNPTTKPCPRIGSGPTTATATCTPSESGERQKVFPLEGCGSIAATPF